MARTSTVTTSFLRSGVVNAANALNDHIIDLVSAVDRGKNRGSHFAHLVLYDSLERSFPFAGSFHFDKDHRTVWGEDDDAIRNARVSGADEFPAYPAELFDCARQQSFKISFIELVVIVQRCPLSFIEQVNFLYNRSSAFLLYTEHAVKVSEKSSLNVPRWFCNIVT